MNFRLVVGLLAIAAISCGGTTASKCTPSSCSGCCDTATNSCVIATNPNQCGAAGLACMQCFPGQQCSGGICVNVSNGGGSSGIGGGQSGIGGGQSGLGGGSAGVGGGQSGTGGGSTGVGGGQTGVGGGQAGVGGGAAVGGGSATGGGTAHEMTIATLKTQVPCAERVLIRNVVVTGVDDLVLGSNSQILTRFWVVDPSAPANATFVEKFYTDLPDTYQPVIGDVVDVEGYWSSIDRRQDREAWRPALRNQFACLGMNGQLLTVTRTGAASVPADFSVPAGFGNAAGGTVKANAASFGRRVSIGGPLQITQANPAAFRRVSAFSATDTVRFGFEVSGGILVNNYKTFRNDGGCPWRDIANDGGIVTFPNGIRGVWDTYSHAPCADGGTGCTAATAQHTNGIVPDTTADFTYVVYPQSCSDIVGVVQ